MARLMIACPVTGEEVFTGIELPEDALEQIPDIVARMLCPACQQEHAWSKRDARVKDSDASSPSGGTAGKR